VHGQRTKTNARTKRGKRVTMGSGRKKSAAKT
jgi:ribosomal protein S13